MLLHELEKPRRFYSRMDIYFLGREKVVQSWICDFENNLSRNSSTWTGLKIVITLFLPIFKSKVIYICCVYGDPARAKENYGNYTKYRLNIQLNCPKHILIAYPHVLFIPSRFFFINITKTESCGLLLKLVSLRPSFLHLDRTTGQNKSQFPQALSEIS